MSNTKLTENSLRFVEDVCVNSQSPIIRSSERHAERVIELLQRGHELNQLIPVSEGGLDKNEGHLRGCIICEDFSRDDEAFGRIDRGVIICEGYLEQTVGDVGYGKRILTEIEGFEKRAKRKGYTHIIVPTEQGFLATLLTDRFGFTVVSCEENNCMLMKDLTHDPDLEEYYAEWFKKLKALGTKAFGSLDRSVWEHMEQITYKSFCAKKWTALRKFDRIFIDLRNGLPGDSGAVSREKVSEWLLSQSDLPELLQNYFLFHKSEERYMNTYRKAELICEGWIQQYSQMSAQMRLDLIGEVYRRLLVADEIHFDEAIREWGKMRTITLQTQEIDVHSILYIKPDLNGEKIADVKGMSGEVIGTLYEIFTEIQCINAGELAGNCLKTEMRYLRALRARGLRIFCFHGKGGGPKYTLSYEPTEKAIIEFQGAQVSVGCPGIIHDQVVISGVLNALLDADVEVLQYHEKSCLNIWQISKERGMVYIVNKGALDPQIMHSDFKLISCANPVKPESISDTALQKLCQSQGIILNISDLPQGQIDTIEEVCGSVINERRETPALKRVTGNYEYSAPNGHHATFLNSLQQVGGVINLKKNCISVTMSSLIEVGGIEAKDAYTIRCHELKQIHSLKAGKLTTFDAPHLDIDNCVTDCPELE